MSNPPAPVPEAECRNLLRTTFLSYVLSDSFLPELGAVKKGKVRDIYCSDKHVIMVASDRVSAFDHVLPSLIPFKGTILNRITRWAFKQTEDIVPNAMADCQSSCRVDPSGVDGYDPNVVVQKKMKNLNVECIVRGYLWGSMAAAYEKGERKFCGLDIPDGLLRFQKLQEPIFTPTTKAEVGHDENMTYEEVEKLLGREMASRVREISLKLYERGCQIVAKSGLILVDTKYEFGVDENGKLHVIDEVNTPDSSRLCDAREWASRYEQIEKAMASRKGEAVSAFLATPEGKPLKITELSKQYVRDVLIDGGYKEGKTPPDLTVDQVVECAYRYIRIYERLTGRGFEFPSFAQSPAQRLVTNLSARGLIVGCCAAIFAGSNSDMPHLEKIKTKLTALGIPSHIRICSAHKQPSKLESLIETYNKSVEPLVVVACAGGTDALSGTASFLSLFPVVTCPPDGDNRSALTNPPGSSNAVVTSPDNVAKFAAQCFALSVPTVRNRLSEGASKKIGDLNAADCALYASPI